MKAKDLLAAARAAQGIPSNYRLARVLGVPDNTMTRWHTGKNAPNSKYAAKLAEMAGMDPGAVVAAMQAESATDPEERAMWEGIAARLSKLMSVCALVILSLWTTGGPDGGAMAATPGARADSSPVNNAGANLYIVGFSRLASFFGRFVHFLRTMAADAAIHAQREFRQA